jgi:sugar/nucleoside kinase (ribokinase family)
LEWTHGADLCFPNLEEGALLGKEDDPNRVAERLLDHYHGVVLKLGAAGALYAGDERVRLPAEPGRVADTTGAGDALCAGFLAAWLSGASPAPALRRGVEVAARVVDRLGARPGVDSRAHG